MLEELRKKPRALKEAYALWGAVALTALVALVWTVSLPTRISDTDALEISGETQAAGAFSQFLDQIKTNVSETWNQGKAALSGPESMSSTTDQASSTPEATVSGNATSSLNGPDVIIATSSSSSVKVATSSSENR
jgi:hypothetical protein